MNIIVAQTAGFCFGVNRAVELVYRLVESGEKVATLGPIIHNPQVMQDLSKRGVREVDQVSQVQPGETLVIRSHGVGKSVYQQAKEQGVALEDATCPFVAKIHAIVEKGSRQGKIVLIAGDDKHPEVVGIRGHCVGESYVFSNQEELEILLKSHNNFMQNHLILVSQTTFQSNLWKECAKTAKKVCTNLEIFDTICSATRQRQKEAQSLAKQCDLMIIVGGRHSSNTYKLYQVCSRFCEAVLVETKDELRRIPFLPSRKRIGITAGASTPAYIIKEVHDIMSDVNRNTLDQALRQVLDQDNAEQTNSEELSFAELLEQSEQQAVYRVGKRIKGVVTSVAKNEVQVDIGGKQAGLIPASELSSDPSASPEDLVKCGDELDLIVTRVNEQDGLVTLSKKRFDAEKGFQDIIEAQEQGTILSGTITDVVRGGALVLTNGIKIFIPISQLSDHRVESAEEFLGQPVEFKVIEVNPARRRAVASVRRVLAERRKQAEDKFWETIHVGDTFSGTVKSLTNYGAFVDIGGVDGMIHITELSWAKIKHPSEVVNVGDRVEVYIKDLNEETRKISLGYRKQEDNPWEIFKEKYSAGQTVSAKVVSITQFGAFAEIIPGVDGLIHISQIADHRIDQVSDALSVGQQVEAKILDIDYDHKRISLSIRALLKEQEQASQQEQKAADEAAVASIEGVELQRAEDEQPQAE